MKKDIVSLFLYLAPTWAFLVVLCLAPSDSLSWGARDHSSYSTKCPEIDHMNTPKPHNYVVEEAIRWLHKKGKLPFRPYEPVGTVDNEHTEECRSDVLNAIDYVIYGLGWADYVWQGPPEQWDMRVAGINDWLIEQTGGRLDYTGETWGPPPDIFFYCLNLPSSHELMS